MSGSYDHEDGFLLLNDEISKHETTKNSQEGTSRRLFYLALPPSVYPSVSKMIRTCCMNQCRLYSLIFWECFFNLIKTDYKCANIYFSTSWWLDSDCCWETIWQGSEIFRGTQCSTWRTFWWTSNLSYWSLPWKGIGSELGNFFYVCL